MSDGALCVFLDGYTGREGKPVPLIIRKSDGGYGYATTDLATIRHRVRDLEADRILYVIGAPQALHLNMVWDTARLAGWLPDEIEVVHVQIGNVLGPDRKILRTRAGNPLKLMELLDEAIAHARAVVDEARPDLDRGVRAAIAPQVGIGAVKYADLSVAHDSEYVFDLDRMVSLTGNTGPYLQYAAARIRSIFRTAGTSPGQADARIGSSSPPSERSPWRCSTSATSWSRSATSSSRTGSAPTSSTSPSSSPRSTSSARCSRPTRRPAAPGSPCAPPPGRARPGARPPRDRAPRADVRRRRRSGAGRLVGERRRRLADQGDGRVQQRAGAAAARQVAERHASHAESGTSRASTPSVGSPSIASDGTSVTPSPAATSASAFWTL